MASITFEAQSDSEAAAKADSARLDGRTDTLELRPTLKLGAVMPATGILIAAITL